MEVFVDGSDELALPSGGGGGSRLFEKRHGLGAVASASVSNAQGVEVSGGAFVRGLEGAFEMGDGFGVTAAEREIAAEVEMGEPMIGLVMHRLLVVVDGSGGITAGVEEKSEAGPGVGVLGIDADGLRKGAARFVEALAAGEENAVVVMGVGDIGVDLEERTKCGFGL